MWQQRIALGPNQTIRDLKCILNLHFLNTVYVNARTRNRSLRQGSGVIKLFLLATPKIGLKNIATNKMFCDPLDVKISCKKAMISANLMNKSQEKFLILKFSDP